MADWDSGNAGNSTKWIDGGADNFQNNYDATGGNPEFNFEKSFETNGDGPVESGGGACRNCGQDGHFARDCDQPRKPMACFNCGEEGHSKADCTQPRKFTGQCRVCEETGHQARDCPNKKKICKQCLMEDDHDTIDCKNPKVIDLSKVSDMTEDQAWSLLKEASDDRDIGDFKDALKILSKAAPEMTYPRIEKELRRRGFKIFIIGLKKEIPPTFTNVNLQGEAGKTHTIGFFTSAICQRPILLDAWPKDAEDNLSRLADAGISLERGVPVCSNCGELGHVRRDCPQEPGVVEAPKIICALCGEEGHRVRDCTQERRTGPKPIECRICGGDHKAADCENKPAITCRNCGEEGHMAKDCTNERVMLCNNCSKAGHISRDCPEPKDWSKVKCKHCGEMGHASASRCKKMADDDGNFGKAGADQVGGSDDFGGDDWKTEKGGNHTSSSSAQKGWETDAVHPVPATASGW